MSIMLFLRLVGISITGMLTALLVKNSSMEETTNKANLQYGGFWQFIRRDWRAIGLNLLAIVTMFLLFGDLVNKITDWAQTQTYTIFNYDVPLKFVWYIFNGLLFYATGYFGQDFILKSVLKSVQNRLIKEAIDYKTNIADTATGNLENKTPLK